MLRVYPRLTRRPTRPDAGAPSRAARPGASRRTRRGELLGSSDLRAGLRRVRPARRRTSSGSAGYATVAARPHRADARRLAAASSRRAHGAASRGRVDERAVSSRGRGARAAPGAPVAVTSASRSRRSSPGSPVAPSSRRVRRRARQQPGALAAPGGRPGLRPSRQAARRRSCGAPPATGRARRRSRPGSAGRLRSLDAPAVPARRRRGPEQRRRGAHRAARSSRGVARAVAGTSVRSRSGSWAVQWAVSNVAEPPAGRRPSRSPSQVATVSAPSSSEMAHVDRVVDRQHDQRRHVERERLAQALAEVVGGLAAPGRHAEGLGELDEVGVREVDAEVARRTSCPASRRSSRTAGSPRSTFTNGVLSRIGGLELLAVHEEAAVAVDGDDLAVGVHELGGDRGRHREAHARRGRWRSAPCSARRPGTSARSRACAGRRRR